jgi:hypothetical protein
MIEYFPIILPPLRKDLLSLGLVFAFPHIPFPSFSFPLIHYNMAAPSRRADPPPIEQRRKPLLEVMVRISKGEGERLLLLLLHVQDLLGVSADTVDYLGFGVAVHGYVRVIS